jgi:hypothetical protein
VNANLLYTIQIGSLIALSLIVWLWWACTGLPALKPPALLYCVIISMPAVLVYPCQCGTAGRSIQVPKREGGISIGRRFFFLFDAIGQKANRVDSDRRQEKNDVIRKENIPASKTFAFKFIFFCGSYFV